jgi:hypothetical protein
MTQILDGSTSSGPVSSLSGTQIGYRFQRGGSTILALWDYQAASSTVNIAIPAGGVEVCDWMGKCTTATSSTGHLNVTVGGSPTYVIGPGL